MSLRPLLLLLMNPSAGWAALTASPQSVAKLLTRMILPASLVSALAVTLGTAVFNREWMMDFGYDTRAENAFAVGTAALVLLVSYTFVLAWVFTRMGKLYGSSGN